MLTQLLFRAKVAADAEGWFTYSVKSLYEAVGIGKDAQASARERLAGIGVIESQAKGYPPRTSYRIIYPSLINLLEAARLRLEGNTRQTIETHLEGNTRQSMAGITLQLNGGYYPPNMYKHNKQIKQKEAPALPEDSKGKKQRKRDFVFEGLVQASSINPAMIEGKRGELNKNVGILRKWYRLASDEPILTDSQLYELLLVFPDWFYEGASGTWRKENGVRITPAVVIKHWQDFASYVGFPIPTPEDKS
jgi:hypothetical protein